MATHSSMLAWKIPWTEEPGRLQSMGVSKELDMTWQLNNNKVSSAGISALLPVSMTEQQGNLQARKKSQTFQSLTFIPLLKPALPAFRGISAVLSQNCFAITFAIIMGFPGGSGSGDSMYSAGDQGSIPGRKDPLEKGMATHSRILARRIPWTKESTRLQPGTRGLKELDMIEPQTSHAANNNNVSNDNG